MKPKTLGLAFSLAVAAAAGSAGQESLRVLSSDFPPYTIFEGGLVGEMSTEVVRAVLAEASMKGSFEVLPWARAYERVLQGEGDLIYSIVRTPQRESSFKWVGVIAPNDIYLIALASRTDIVVKSLEDARKYTIGTTIRDVREQYLLSKGFVLGQDIEEASADSLNMQKLVAGRIDLIAVQDIVAYSIAAQEQVSRDKLTLVYRLDDISAQGQYLACSKALPDSIVARLKAGLENVKASGEYAKIQAKYGK